MPGILPNTGDGGVVIRDGTRTCTNPANVSNAYCPPRDFTSSCQLTALPTDCTARITAEQVNAIVSEMLSFAVCLNPEGHWACGSLTNLCSNFTAWWEANEPHGDGVTITVDGGPDDSPNRFRIIPVGTVNAICNDNDARDALVQCVLSDQANNQSVIGNDGGIYTPPGQELTADQIADMICADASARTTLAACVRSPLANNQITLDGNGRLYTPPITGDDMADSICADTSARQTLAACVLSGDANNRTVIGTDGRLFTPAQPPEDICGNLTRRREIAACLVSGNADNLIRIPAVGDRLLYFNAVDVVQAICATPAARQTLAACVLSSDEFNGLGIGSDNLLYNPEGCAVGSVAITAPDFVGPLPAGTFTHYQEDFFIPNPYPFNILFEITGATHVRVHDEDLDNTFSYLASWIHNNDPGGAGTDFTMWHWNEGYFPAGGPNNVVFDNTQTFRRFMTIGPGGRAVSARFEVSSVNGIPADVAIRNNTIAFNWNGCQIESLNGA